MTKDELVLKLSNEAAERGFRVKLANSGVYFMPIIDGEPLSEDDFKALDEEIKIDLSKSSEALQRETTDTIRKIREVEMDAENAIQEWEHQIALYAVGIHIDDLKDKYNEYPFVTAYLDAVKEDILKNIEHLAGPRYSDEQQSILTHLLMMKRREDNPMVGTR